MYFYLCDSLGSISDIVDSSGIAIEHYLLSPFGSVKMYNRDWVELTDSSIPNRYIFSGRYYDIESGLYDYRFRMYSPSMGRFCQFDPIHYYSDINSYRYCANNPIKYYDPMGLKNQRHSAVDTYKALLEAVRALSASPYSWKYIQGVIASYDFGVDHDYEGDLFCVPSEGWLTPSEFANYLAGYITALVYGQTAGLPIARLAGIKYNWDENRHFGDDARSIELINGGNNDAGMKNMIDGIK